MGQRFIHKDGRVVPIHSDHGDQPAPGPEHAAPKNPPNTPAPVAGKEEHNHPEARPAEAPKAPEAPAKVAEAAPVMPKLRGKKEC